MSWTHYVVVTAIVTLALCYSTKFSSSLWCRSFWCSLIAGMKRQTFVLPASFSVVMFSIWSVWSLAYVIRITHAKSSVFHETQCTCVSSNDKTTTCFWRKLITWLQTKDKNTDEWTTEVLTEVMTSDWQVFWSRTIKVFLRTVVEAEGHQLHEMKKLANRCTSKVRPLGEDKKYTMGS